MLCMFVVRLSVPGYIATLRSQGDSRCERLLARLQSISDEMLFYIIDHRIQIAYCNATPGRGYIFSKIPARQVVGDIFLPLIGYLYYTARYHTRHRKGYLLCTIAQLRAMDISRLEVRFFDFPIYQIVADTVDIFSFSCVLPVLMSIFLSV